MFQRMFRIRFCYYRSRFENPDSPLLKRVFENNRILFLTDQSLIGPPCPRPSISQSFSARISQGKLGKSLTKIGAYTSSKTRDDETGKAGEAICECVQEFLENPPERRRNSGRFWCIWYSYSCCWKQSPIATIDAPLKEKAPSFFLSHSKGKELVVWVPLCQSPQRPRQKFPIHFIRRSWSHRFLSQNYDSEGLLNTIPQARYEPIWRKWFVRSQNIWWFKQYYFLQTSSRWWNYHSGSTRKINKMIKFLKRIALQKMECTP